MEVRKCAICGKEFMPRGKRNIYCSPECYQISSRKRRREQYMCQRDRILKKQAEYRRKYRGEKEKRQGNGAEIRRINALADKQHMSYGQYVAKKWQEERRK